MRPLRVVDLFAGGRGWSDAFRDRGHDVVATDYDERFAVDLVADIRELSAADFPWRPDIVLASPPCEGFSVMNIGKNWTKPTDVPPHQPKTPRAREALELVEHTRRLIAELEPTYFVIENPRAKLRKLPVVGDLERRTVTYCQYGLTTMKPTDLFGGFPPSLVLKPPCKNGDACHVRAPRGSRTAGSVQGVGFDPNDFHLEDPTDALARARPDRANGSTVDRADRPGSLQRVKAEARRLAGTSNAWKVAAMRALVPYALAETVCLATEIDVDAGASPELAGQLGLFG